jgi:hypothetical protein
MGKPHVEKRVLEKLRGNAAPGVAIARIELTRGETSLIELKASGFAGNRDAAGLATLGVPARQRLGELPTEAPV